MTIYVVMMSNKYSCSRHIAALFEDKEDAEKYLYQQKEDQEYWYYITTRTLVLSRHHERQG